jgi:hypothetical protein
LSHLKERKEKTCLNCNASLYGRYCHLCGQENLEPKESVWHLVSHFFNDITHFDGKFFKTVKLLITKPGFLSTEYMLGRRVTYLNPVRMYVFTSAIFFLLLFSMTNPDKIMKLNAEQDTEMKKKGVKDWEKEKMKLGEELKNKKDDSDSEEIKEDLELINAKIAMAKKLYGDTSTRKFSQKEAAILLVQAGLDSLKNAGLPAGSIAQKIKSAIALDSSREKETGINLLGANKYKSADAYDSAQKVLPDNLKDGWLKKIFRRKLIILQEEDQKDKSAYFEHFRENFLHSFPKILFFSLPFFALILKLVYIRRKKFYYVDHGIFAIDVYCATFILMLVLILLNQLGDMASWGWLHVLTGIISFAIWIYIYIYFYKAMRRFYQQGRVKTILKYFLIGFLAFLVDIFLVLVFVVISAIST